MRTKILLFSLPIGLSVFSPHAFAFYNASEGRWLNRDPIGEWGGVNINGFVANDPMNRVDFLGLTVGHCQDPCGDAKRQGLDKGYDGGVICCAGVKYVCVWKPGKATNSTAVTIVTLCIEAHEKDHLDDINCPRIWCYGFPTRPPFKKGKIENAEECSAYKIELNCLQTSRSLCGGDPQCEKDVDAEIKFVTDERNTRKCPP